MRFSGMPALALSAAILAGCAAGNGASGSRDASVTFAAGGPPSGLTGYHSTEIRVVKPSLKGHTNNHFEEITAECIMRGNGFSAAIQTPSTIRLPILGSASKPVNLSCTNGSTTVERTMRPINLSQRARDGQASNTMTGIILLSPIIIAGAAATQIPTMSDGRDIYGYDNVTIKIK